ncbi:N-(5'-phosphoribosyl)anthranilate isomerase [Roseovarius sp. JS7-11]|uniref:N-(5'-phosphoribosyl)anthranilate isomerase n=1 Tax=Nioella sp. TaxID=1912091 RepID=UPI0008FD4538|nr:N-(5'-phosphoribosyl)anthranilate isomerase [Roseovarius sp. JS7-11]
MSYLRPIHRNDIWFDQVFSAKAVTKGGVIRRSKADVDRKVGRDRLELEVRKRGFHLVEAGSQFLIICDRGDIRIVC